MGAAVLAGLTLWLVPDARQVLSPILTQRPFLATEHREVTVAHLWFLYGPCGIDGGLALPVVMLRAVRDRNGPLLVVPITTGLLLSGLWFWGHRRTNKFFLFFPSIPSVL